MIIEMSKRPWAITVEDKIRIFFSGTNPNDYRDCSIEEAEQIRNDLDRAIEKAAAAAYFKGRV